MFYVYALLDPTIKFSDDIFKDGLPFYIGKGKDCRAEHHLFETKDNTENFKKWCHIKGIRNKGFEPIIVKIKENINDENDAYDFEAELIKKYGRKDIDNAGILTNICIDNRPPNSIGRKHSIETKKLLSNLRTGENNPNYGNIHTDEWKAKHSTRMSGKNNPFYGKTHTDEQKKKWGYRGYRLGQKNSEEHNEKIRIFNTGKKFSEETKSILREKRKLQIDSNETRIKKSESMKLYWKRKKGLL